MSRCLLSLVLLLTVSPALAQGTPGLMPKDYQARRQRVMDHMEDGLVVVPARPTAKDFTETGLHQDLSFYYLTGLEHVLGAVLVLDSRTRTSHLFLPGRLPGWAGAFPRPLQPGAAAATATGLDEVAAWSAFEPFLAGRLAAGPPYVLYTPAAPEAIEALAVGFPPPHEPAAVWTVFLANRWPDTVIRSAQPVLTTLRAIKEPAEVEALRRAGKTSSVALRAGLRALAPGQTQRSAEGAVVAACLDAGADGIAFWPWLMSGPNSALPAPLYSFGDYRHLNRTMQAGELVRVDIGCEADHYQGDVGRTAPVSGRFEPGQREAWDLLVRAYHGGLAVMRDGVPWTDVAAASKEAVRQGRASVQTNLGREAADLLLDDTRMQWHHHAVGLHASESPPEILRTGMVIAFEPMFTLAGQGYYLEDMIHITPDGYELLTQDLPYTAEEIEAAMQ